MTQFKNQLQLFSTTDYAKILKVLIGVFTSFILAQLLHFSSVSVSASTVLVILMSSNESSSRSYLRRRALSQFIGVPVAVLFYYLISSCPGIPSFLRPAVTVTIAVCAALVINLVFHLVNQWSSLVIAVFIVISFEAQNPGYPLLRIEQVLLGILLGYLIHRFILPVNVFVLACTQFKNLSNSFFDVMSRIFVFSKNGSLEEFPLSMLSTKIIELEKSMSAVQADLKLKSFSRYDKHNETLKILKSCMAMMQNAIEIFELLETFPTKYNDLREEFKECFVVNFHVLLNLHQTICDLFDQDVFPELHSVEIRTILLQSKEETILMSRIYEYEMVLNQLVTDLNEKRQASKLHQVSPQLH